MSRSYTPKYRVVLTENTGKHTQSWTCKDHGRATDNNLERFVSRQNQSYLRDGVNAHLSKMYGYAPYISRAELINQFTGQVVATFKAAMFQVI